jgi:hypothetical protein
MIGCVWRRRMHPRPRGASAAGAGAGPKLKSCVGWFVCCLAVSAVVPGLGECVLQVGCSLVAVCHLWVRTAGKLAGLSNVGWVVSGGGACIPGLGERVLQVRVQVQMLTSFVGGLSVV